MQNGATNDTDEAGEGMITGFEAALPVNLAGPGSVGFIHNDVGENIEPSMSTHYLRRGAIEWSNLGPHLQGTVCTV